MADDWPTIALRGLCADRRVAVSKGHFALDLVIQTASGVLTGRFGPREAVTLLATQAPQARAEAPLVAEREPERAEAYAELLGSIRAELGAMVFAGEEARDCRALARELDRVVEALSA